MSLRVGIGFGRLSHWHDGLGEFSRQLGRALAERAPRLRESLGVELAFHLPARFHGEFGPEVRYLPTHTTQRWLHMAGSGFDLWHTLHQHIRLKPPLGTRLHLETVHDLNFLHTKQGAKRARYLASMGRRLRQRDAIVAITHHVETDLKEQFPALQTPVHVIHNGVADLTGIVQQPVEGVASPYLLHISRMAPSKNIVALLELAAAWPDKTLVLAGASSPYTREVERLVTERGLRNVLIRQDLSEGQKAWLYANCEGFLFPSLAEGFGLPPIEAMRFGKPVFLSRLTSLPEVGGDAACYFDDFNGQAMRAVVEKGLSQATERRQALVAQAARFNWSRCADAYVALYLKLLGV